jgi:hypothetical protein
MFDILRKVSTFKIFNKLRINNILNEGKYYNITNYVIFLKDILVRDVKKKHQFRHDLNENHQISL